MGQSWPSLTEALTTITRPTQRSVGAVSTHTAPEKQRMLLQGLHSARQPASPAAARSCQHLLSVGSLFGALGSFLAAFPLK